MNSVYQRDIAKPTVPLTVILILALGAQLMVVLDGLIVSIALPQMRTRLDLSLAAQQWVIDGYLITFGGLLLLAARAADVIGHRRVFLIGVSVFTLGSLGGGLAPDSRVLLVARAVQGVGAAALAPSSLSLLTMTHTGDNRARALSLWSAASGSAGALGLVLGGVVTGTLGWRWVLLINVPIGVALWITGSMSLLPSGAADWTGFDFPGAATVTFGIGTMVYGISQAEQAGWTSSRVAVSLLLAVAFLGLFWIVERRSIAPLIPRRILQHRNIVAADVIMACLGAIMTATLFFLSLYQQRVLNYTPLRTGLALAPMSLVITLGAFTSKALLPKVGTRRLLLSGALIMSIGLMWMATMTVHSNYPLHVLGPTVLWAAGASIVTMPCVAIATGGVEPKLAGLASGLVNTARQTGGAIGLAVLTTIAAAASAHAHQGSPSNSLVHGYRIALAVAAIISSAVAILALATEAPDRR